MGPPVQSARLPRIDKAFSPLMQLLFVFRADPGQQFL
jgi:hypothetical protein